MKEKKLNLTRKKEIGVLHSYVSNDRATVVAQVELDNESRGLGFEPPLAADLLFSSLSFLLSLSNVLFRKTSLTDPSNGKLGKKVGKCFK